MSDALITREEIEAVLGDEADSFIAVMTIVEDIIDNPGKYNGIKALGVANRLAALRTKIGVTANLLKTADKNINTRRKKDILISLEHNLQENINVLKLAARVDAGSAGLI